MKARDVDFQRSGGHARSGVLGKSSSAWRNVWRPDETFYRPYALGKGMRPVKNLTPSAVIKGSSSSVLQGSRPTSRIVIVIAVVAAAAAAAAV